MSESAPNFSCNLLTGDFERTYTDPGEYEGIDGPIVVAASYLAAKKEAISILQDQRAGLADLIATIRASRKGWL